MRNHQLSGVSAALSPKAVYQLRAAEQHLVLGRHQAALTCFRQALRHAQDHPFILFRIGIANHLLGLRDEAIRLYRKALALDAQLGEVASNLGKALLETGRFHEAVTAFEQASELLPGNPVPFVSCASALMGLNRLGEAEQCCRNALLIAPGFAEAHWNLSLILLKQGRYHEGWQEYEWRWQTRSFPSVRYQFLAPRWDGSPVAGKRVILHTEQGFGDAIQFARYLPLMHELGAILILVCQPVLLALFAELPCPLQLVESGKEMPECDVYLPLLSLPLVFATELDSIPASSPYLSPPADRRADWKGVCAMGKQRKVGLAWSGNPKPDPNRSLPPSLFAELASVPDTDWYSLQVGGKPTQADEPWRQKLALHDLTGRISDFADTAALICQLDLVISVDTAVAHLAGALGIPTWLLLPFAADWRWLEGRADSPWYPTMTLFRQSEPGNWASVVKLVCDRLHSI
ncbi:tetratricopeptide repeat-containing glycosyltransferase family protein [Trichlorobacter lovleyi]|uniref:tetratricopeptide repeat-containing glycosyltransferase family protein n=1 Tax=Trichlorobacter lovleyi TaxID=313985 RepID=UPI0023F1FFD2|nr:tetratricopeptide repeat-containing glycosyltransferase family protein [Trichlorobacter lovleyi]